MAHLPLPVNGQAPTVASLKADIRALRGKMALVESTNAGWGGDSSSTRPSGDWQPRRLGADPPMA